MISLRDEVVGLARDLIRIDTSNPPGNETEGAEHLAAYLGAAGVDCELVGPDPARLNLVARVAGRGEGPSIMLMAHLDVVPAPDANWTVPPFDGVVSDDRLLGRGAADMKGELAARAVAIAALARSGQPPSGDVVLVAESDEENNTADVGMSWLVRERPDLGCDFALNEGGGWLLELACGRRVMTVSIGEKPTTSVRLRFSGRAGHASTPNLADNPLRHVATAIDALLAYRPPSRLSPVVGAALTALGAPSGGDAEAIAWAAGQHPVLAGLVPVISRTTVTPTGLATHEPANVIPPFADVICDCRTLPGETESDIRAHVAAAIGGELAYELDLLEPLEGGTESAIDTALYRACEEYASSRLGATLLPVLSTGFTDSHWVRKGYGTVAYGFAPVISGDVTGYLDGMHGADEFVAVADLVEMAEFHLATIAALSG
jgi:acetylornithine deacetylase/succinyl-diaminopimelate desuccinylase-like protein